MKRRILHVPAVRSTDRLTADEQRAFLAQYAPDFMDAAFGVKPYPEVAGLDPFVRHPIGCTVIAC